MNLFRLIITIFVLSMAVIIPIALLENKQKECADYRDTPFRFVPARCFVFFDETVK